MFLRQISDPHLAQYAYLIGCQRTGAAAEAIAHFEQILRTKPDFARAHYDLALNLQTQGRTDDTRRHFREAARLVPSDEEIANAFRRFDTADQAHANFPSS